MSVRADLQHLTPEALSQMTNAGLVKRAVRELEGGYRPACELDEAQTLTARFPDSIVVTWSAGRTIADAVCSCGSQKICRHRLIAALAYRQQTKPAAEEPKTASPANVSDEHLQRVIPRALLALAEQQAREGLTVAVRYKRSGEPCDTARLPAATVRFWGGDAIEAARCDCVRTAACEHVAIAVWAFRQAEHTGQHDESQQVRLGSVGHAVAIETQPFVSWIDTLARHGVAQGVAPLAQGLSTALEAAHRQGAVWVSNVMRDLENWSAAYAKRSALYESKQGVALVAELALRLGAGALPGNAKEVLGVGQAGEVELDRLRLLCLGARTTRDAERRNTRVVLADVDTATQLVLNHEWTVPQGQAQEEARRRAAERLAPGVRLEQLAQGQLLSQQAKRLADGTLKLAKQRSSQNNVLPQSADWGALSPPLRHVSVAAIREQHRAHPIAHILPRHAAREFVVFSPTRIDHVSYDPNRQVLSAWLLDANEEFVIAQRTYESHARHALDALAAAYLGDVGPLRHIAGPLRWRDGIATIEPWAAGCDRMIVPDFAQASGALARVALGDSGHDTDDALRLALNALRDHLATLLHEGALRLPRSWAYDAGVLVGRLRTLGFQTLSECLAGLIRQATEVAATGSASGFDRGLLELCALLQLHEDAAVTVRLSA